MRLLILGASGRTGQFATTSALKQGYTVTALVRKASSMQAADGLTIVEGTPTSQRDIESAFARSASADPVQAVLVTLNATRASDSPFSKPVAPPMFMRDCVRNALAVMMEHDVARIVIMSTFGAGSSWEQLSCLMKPIFRYTNMSFQTEDHDAVDAEVRMGDWVDYTLVRPARLAEGEAGPVKQFGEEGKGVGLMATSTRASVAEFLVKAVQSEALRRKAVVVAN